jgi:hypothetical protein
VFLAQKRSDFEGPAVATSMHWSMWRTFLQAAISMMGSLERIQNLFELKVPVTEFPCNSESRLNNYATCFGFFSNCLIARCAMVLEGVSTQ